MTARVLAIVVLAGCGASTGSAGPSRPLECGAVIASIFGRSAGFVRDVWRGQQPDLSEQLASLMDRLKPVMEQSCREDRWSVELLGCLDGMTVTDDPHKCNHLFTVDQATSLSRRMLALMTRLPAA